jgi:hypothetical protein
MCRLSAVLFFAPDLDVLLKPLKVDGGAKKFSNKIMAGQVNVGWFKDVMGKRWRWREGNEVLEDEVSRSARMRILRGWYGLKGRYF